MANLDFKKDISKGTAIATQLKSDNKFWPNLPDVHGMLEAVGMYYKAIFVVIKL